MPNKKHKKKTYGRESPTMFKEHVHNIRELHEDHINVNVVVNEKQDDCLTSCFQSCFKSSVKAAK